jgi:hypothetical protein
MDDVELMPMLSQELQRIALMELERVARLRVDVHSHYLESCPVVSHAGATSAAEEVQESHRPTFPASARPAMTSRQATMIQISRSAPSKEAPVKASEQSRV